VKLKYLLDTVDSYSPFREMACARPDSERELVTRGFTWTSVSEMHCE